VVVAGDARGRVRKALFSHVREHHPPPPPHMYAKNTVQTSLKEAPGFVHGERKRVCHCQALGEPVWVTSKPCALVRGNGRFGDAERQKNSTVQLSGVLEAKQLEKKSQRHEDQVLGEKKHKANVHNCHQVCHTGLFSHVA